MLLRLATYTAALLIPFAFAQTCTPGNNAICTRGKSSAGETGNCIQISGTNGRCAYRLNDCYAGYYSVRSAFSSPTVSLESQRNRAVAELGTQNSYNDCQACPAGTSSPAKAPNSGSCTACTTGSYSTGMGGPCTPCPAGSTTAGPGSTMMEQCNVCKPGYEPNVGGNLTL